MCERDGTGSLAKSVEMVLQIFKSIKFCDQLNKYHMFSEVSVFGNENFVIWGCFFFFFFWL